MTRKKSFSGPIENPGGGGAFVRVPFDVEEAFGSKRPKVKATIDGQAHRGRLVRMGSEDHMLLILKEIREKIGKSFGDVVQVTVEADTEVRVVTVPPDLARELKKSGAAQSTFEKLSYTHQKEYVRWIEEAKRPDTRRARVAKTVEMLKQGTRAP
jgi:Bacteriocin-protection, YdeI or OmpD-Associated/Domain of unknown function (DUF1905)